MIRVARLIGACAAPHLAGLAAWSPMLAFLWLGR